MARYAFSVTRRIPSPAATVHAIISDYHVGHQEILPRPPFITMTVEKGGNGPGTVIFTTMKLLGKVRSFRAAIDEPIPGRLIRESEVPPGLVTTYEIVPDGAEACRLTIATDFAVAGGFFGRFQGWLAAKALVPTYERELDTLTAYAQGRPRA
jgi:hypothetical protein